MGTVALNYYSMCLIVGLIFCTSMLGTGSQGHVLVEYKTMSEAQVAMDGMLGLML